MASRRYEQVQRRRARERQMARRRRQNRENGGDLRLWALAALLFAGAFWVVAQNLTASRDPAPSQAVFAPTAFRLPPTPHPALVGFPTPTPAPIDISPRVTMRAGSGAQLPAAGVNPPLFDGAPTALPLPGVTPLAGAASAADVSSRPRPIPPTPQPVAPGLQLGAFCRFNAPVSMRLFDWETGQTTSLSAEWIARLPLSWDASASIWRGYAAAKPFDEPDDLRILWRLNLIDAAGGTQFIDIGRSPSSPRLYVYAYDNVVPFADRNGRYFGLHPCRAFSIQTTAFDYLIEAARAFQEFNGAYPDLIPPDDPRWQRGFVEPIEGQVNLRALPSAFNNDPVFVLTRRTEVWYAVDPRSWHDWAQIKIGGTHAWVHTGFVRFNSS
jgi:hypothetical protein